VATAFFGDRPETANAGGVLGDPIGFPSQAHEWRQAFLDGLAGPKHGLDTNRFNERVSGA
jgi:hypothetical protein